MVPLNQRSNVIDLYSAAVRNINKHSSAEEYIMHIIEIERLYLFCIPLIIPELSPGELEVIERIGAWVGESERRRTRLRRRD